MSFVDRRDAGRQLATRLAQVSPDGDLLVLGLPRGGVPVAAEVASELGVPLDVMVIRKIGMPGNPEFAIGAIGGAGVMLDRQLIERLGISQQAVDEVVAHEGRELRRREQLYRVDRPPVPLDNKTVVIVDDGLATGSTMALAVRQARAHYPRRVIVAVPVGSPTALARIAELADEVVVVLAPRDFQAVGQWYDDFDQTSDAEVVAALANSTRDARI